MTCIRQTIRAAIPAIVAAMALALGLLPFAASPAWADEAASPYGLYIGNTAVTAKNASDILGDNGSVSYDPATQTLTLDNASLQMKPASESMPMMYSSGTWYGISCNHGLTIALVGDNSISGSEGIEAYYAIGVGVEGALAFIGNGALDIDIATTLPKPPSEPSYGYTPPFVSTYGVVAMPLTPTVLDPNDPKMPEYGDITIDEGVSISMSLRGVGDDIPGLIGGIGGGKVVINDANLEISLGSVIFESLAIYALDGLEALGASDVKMSLGPLNYRDDLHVTFYNGNYTAGIEALNSQIHIGDTARVSISSESSNQGTLGMRGLSVALDGMSTTTLAIGEASPSRGIVIEGIAETPFTPAPTTPDNAIEISDCANVQVMAATLPFSQDPVLGGHKIGGAFASKTYAAGTLTDPEGTTEWTSALGALGGEDSPFKYVRIPGSAMIARIAGDEANQTAAAIAAQVSDKSDVIVLAREDDFADALGATGLAGVLHCPIVLTNREALSPAAAAQIKALGATKCYIIGGTGAMKVQLESDLKSQTNVTMTERLWGNDCYDTSLACAKEILKLKGADGGTAIAAMSMNFQDALSISPVAYKLGLPIVLQTWGATSAERGFTDEAREFLAGMDLYVVGGTGAISAESLEGLHEVERLWGETGYDTSNKIAEWATASVGLNPENVVIACGAQAPKGVDALAGAALAGKIGAPILLVNGNEAMEAADTTTIDGFLAENADKVRFCYVLGGTYVVPQDLYDSIARVIGATSVEL